MNEDGESEADEEIEEIDIRKKARHQEYDSEDEGEDMELDDSVGSDGHEHAMEEESEMSSSDEAGMRQRLADSDSEEEAVEEMSDN